MVPRDNAPLDQAVTILKHRKISAMFTTPKLLEALGDKINVPDAGIKGVFCGGTSMTPQMIRFLTEEVLENRAAFVPTYGNTLMGLACSKPLEPEDVAEAIVWAATRPAHVNIHNVLMTTIDQGNSVTFNRREGRG